MIPSRRTASHPGEILLHEFLEPNQLSQAELARGLQIPVNRVNEIVKGKRGISAETALLLSDYFSVSPELWMNLQMAHDLGLARIARKRKPARSAMRHRMGGRSKKKATA